MNYSKAKYQHKGYEVDHPIVPHGIAVALSGPAVFNFTAPSSPDRHRAAAEIFNQFQPDDIDASRLPDSDIGPLLHDRIARFLVGLDVPRGLSAIGYKNGDVDDLVKGALPQRRVLDLARKWLAGVRTIYLLHVLTTSHPLPKLASRAVTAAKSCRGLLNTPVCPLSEYQHGRVLIVFA